MSIKLSLRWSYRAEEMHDMPKDLFILLQAIVDNGSLRAAASEVGVSYRHAWGMLQQWHKHFSYPLAELRRGRGKGASLTRFGEKLLWEYQRLAARLEPELESLASELSSELAALMDSGPQNTLRIVASHGLVIASLRELAQKVCDLSMDIQFQGSLDSLLQYKSGRYDIAGFHLPEGKLGKGVLPRIRRLINSETDTLVYALRRQQGLMLAPENPKDIQGLADLVGTDIKFINRQRNSGSRVTLDAMLQQAGLDSQQIKGYADEEFTHSAVAAIVASGVADCGFGLEAAAAQFNLAFIPLNWESYWFVLPTKQVDSSVMQQFIGLLGSNEFTQSVVHLPGYDTKRSGTLVVPDKDLLVLL